MKLEFVKWVVRGVNLVVSPDRGSLFCSTWYFCRGFGRPLYYYEHFQNAGITRDVLDAGLQRERKIRQEEYQREASHF